MSSHDPPARRSAVERIGRPQSLAVTAADRIRDLIIVDRLHLGEPLSEASLAAQLGISRTPVRDALLRLQAERLVTIQPQHGSFVFRYDAVQLHNILGLREVLEIGALRIALEVNREATLAALAAEAAAGAPMLALGPQGYQSADTAFHSALVEGSRNPELIDAYDRISGRVRAIRFRLTRTVAQITVSQRDHELIVEALRAGEDDQAEAMLKRHLYNSYRHFLQEFEAKREAD